MAQLEFESLEAYVARVLVEAYAIKMFTLETSELGRNGVRGTFFHLGTFVGAYD